jgi:hypothetical protein
MWTSPLVTDKSPGKRYKIKDKSLLAVVHKEEDESDVDIVVSERVVETKQFTQ